MLLAVAATTERSARDLAAAIRARELSAREVVEAHAWRLHNCQPRTNALACDRFADALAEAEAADERIAAAGPGDELPPFLGVPCTIKESIALRGMPNCAGMVALRDRRSETTAPAAQRLIDAGFIPLGVTNTSELTMWIESVNRVYGRTRNAYDPRRTAGGSSGGEGAAVGSGGSPVGLGSDIAGSIRMPAFFNGVFGHKPSPGLVPNTGQFPSTAGEAAFMLTLGPLARHAEDLMPVTRIVSGPDGRGRALRARASSATPRPSTSRPCASWSPTTPRWCPRAASCARRATGPRRRCRTPARAASTVSLKQLRRALELFLAALGDGAGRHAHRAARAGRRAAARAAVVARRAARARRPHDGDPDHAGGRARSTRHVPAGRTRRALAAVESLRAEVAGILGADAVLLHQPHPRVAPRHGATIGRAWVITPAAVFNLLGLPVTQVPLGLNPRGLPLGVQVAAADGNDHLTIAAALELERRLGGWVTPAADGDGLLRSAGLRPLLRQPLRPPHGAAATASAGSTRRRSGWSASSNARASRARRCSRSAAAWGRSTSSCCGAAPSAPSTSSSRPPTTPRRRGSRARPACRSASSGGCTTSPSTRRRSRPPTSSSCTASSAATPTTSACWAPPRRTRGARSSSATRGAT